VQAATAAPLLYLAQRAGNLALVGLLALLSTLLSLAVFTKVGLSSDDRTRLFATLRSAVGMRERAVPVSRS
jgi:hypothetical protein